MKFTYYGHSCFGVEVAGKHLLFDPFITPNEMAVNINVDNVKADYILVSHGHADHIADCVRIAHHTGAKVIASWEVHEWLNRQGIENTHPMNTGGQWHFDFGTVKCVAAQHSSGLPDGSYGGNPMGFIIKSQQGSFYYSGDTALTLDMQLIPRFAKVTTAILPVGDNFTMGPEDAAEAALMTGSTKVIGVHFDTFGFIRIDHEKALQVFKDKGLELVLPVIGKTIPL